MMNWILALVGLAIYFVVRYSGRKNRTKFNVRFWLKDNWPEILVSILATFAFLVILLDPEAEIDLAALLKDVPFVKSLPTAKLVSLAVGYLNSWLFYTIFKMKK